MKLFKKEKSKKEPKKGGLVIGYEKVKGSEKLYYLDEDVHSLILGATRCGKTRCLIMQTVCHTALSGESMIISDPKGELYDYTAPFLRNLGYEVIPLDFKEPLKSKRYNYLQPVIDAVRRNDPQKAVSLIWDITASITGDTKGERFWHDGEASIIAGSIMSVVFDNMGKPEYQNLTNVYFFINEMCKTDSKGNMLLSKYVDSLDDNHPAKALFGIAEIAPERTRGSFLTMALTTLRLFIEPYIYSMSHESDFDLADTSKKKRAIFIILPDERNTYNSIASLFIHQQYVALVSLADSLGGRLPRRVNYILDEFGNFTKIPNFTNMLTVGGGRGMRFNLVVQSFAQLEEKYGREPTETIKDNCHCLVYLNSTNPNTNKEVSGRLGKYTTSSYGRSATSSNYDSSGSSMSLISRDLLTHTELELLKRPYVIVLYSGHSPALMHMPDISQWAFNDMLGLGDKEFNKKLRLRRNNQRNSREYVPYKKWGIADMIKKGGLVNKVYDMNLDEYPEGVVPEDDDEDEYGVGKQSRKEAIDNLG